MNNYFHDYLMQFFENVVIPKKWRFLDKIPTAKVVNKCEGGTIIEAETFGTGVNMFLLSQGSMVKALAPESFVAEMQAEIEKMCSLYK